MQFVLLMVCAFWEVQALKVNSDSHTQTVYTFGNGTDLKNNSNTHKCLSWDPLWAKLWEPKKGMEQIYFFDLGVQTGQSTFLVLGQDPKEACQLDPQWEHCLVEANKSLKILKAVQVAAAKHTHRDLFTKSKIILVEPSPAYSTLIHSIENKYSHRVQSYAAAITGFNESTVNYPFSVKNETIDPNIVKQAEDEGLPVVDVKSLNLMRLLTRNVRPKDFVIVKMDVEGAEYEILPCLVASPSINLIDVLLIQRHDWMPIAKTEGYVDQLNTALQKMTHHNILVRSDWR